MIIRIPSQTHVNSRNFLNSTSKELQQEIINILKPYIDKKIIKYSPHKGWVEKINTQMNNLHEKYRSKKIDFHFEFNSHTIIAEVKLYYNNQDNPHDSRYIKTWFYVCDLNGDRLKNFIQTYNPRTNYNREEIEETIQKINKMEEELDHLKSGIKEFL